MLQNYYNRCRRNNAMVANNIKKRNPMLVAPQSRRSVDGSGSGEGAV